jgi:hypothetical protein
MSQIPDLPEPVAHGSYTSCDKCSPYKAPIFTADQMRAYGLACYRAGLERAAGVCETLNHGAFGSPSYLNGVSEGSRGCASAIRGEKERG